MFAWKEREREKEKGAPLACLLTDTSMVLCVFTCRDAPMLMLLNFLSCHGTVLILYFVFFFFFKSPLSVSSCVNLCPGPCAITFAPDTVFVASSGNLALTLPLAHVILFLNVRVTCEVAGEAAVNVLDS